MKKTIDRINIHKKQTQHDILKETINKKTENMLWVSPGVYDQIQGESAGHLHEIWKGHNFLISFFFISSETKANTSIKYVHIYCLYQSDITYSL
jgi:hypothetical protein